MRYSGFIFGLRVHSDFLLTDGMTLDVARHCDIIIRASPNMRLHMPPGGGGNCQVISPQEYHLSWPNIGRFLVRNGREILVDADPGIDETRLCHYLTGTVLAALLHQRGRLVFHASAVIIKDGAVGFLGDSGQGKSTLALAMHQYGYPLIADDILPINLRNGTPMIAPGIARFKVTTQTAQALGIAADALRCIPDENKRELRTSAPPEANPVPLKRLYALETGISAAIHPLAGHDALFALIRYAHCIRIISPALLAAFFGTLTQCAASIGIRRLIVPHALNALPDVVRLIVNDMAPTPGRKE